MRSKEITLNVENERENREKQRQMNKTVQRKYEEERKGGKRKGEREKVGWIIWLTIFFSKQNII